MLDGALIDDKSSSVENSPDAFSRHVIAHYTLRKRHCASVIDASAYIRKAGLIATDNALLKRQDPAIANATSLRFITSVGIGDRQRFDRHMDSAADDPEDGAPIIPIDGKSGSCTAIDHHIFVNHQSSAIQHYLCIGRQIKIDCAASHNIE